MAKPKNPAGFEDPKEAGRAGGLASAESRRAKAALRADLKARKKLEDAAEDLAQQLLDAALGNGVFSALDPKERAQYTLKALEYGIGRPRQVEAKEPDRGPELVEADGIAFVVSDVAPPSPPAEDEES